MKKNILNILLSILVVACFASCDLEELPQATASRIAIFESASGLELYTNSFYEMLPSPYDGVFAIDNNSDLVARNGVDTRFMPNALSPTTSGGWSWGNLRNINYFIENAEQSSVPEKDHYLGIAHFFRAYFYFNMVKRFGDVPWIDRTIDVNDEETLYAARDDRFEVMDKVLEDLNYAIANISDKSEPSRTLITKDVARAFKTRVALYEASFRKYHTDYGKQGTANQWFEEVIKTADEITGYSLVEGTSAYRDLFLQKSPNTTEVILAVTLDADLQVFSSRNRRVISPTYGDRPSLTRRFIKDRKSVV